MNTDLDEVRQELVGLVGACMTSSQWLMGLKGLPEVDELLIYDRG